MTCLLASLDNKWKKAIRIMLQTTTPYSFINGLYWVTQSQ
jgi:hypothetical protein